jgi:hypothetical protein
VDDEEEEDRAEEEVVALDEIAGPDVLGVILDERGPCLAARLASAGPHVLLNRSLAHADADLEQLAADALGSPESIPGGHLADQPYGVARHLVAGARLGLVPPEEPKAQAVPAKDRFWLDQGDGAAPTRKQTGCEQQTKSVCGGESWTGRLSAEHHDLVAKQGVFHEEFAPAANGVDQRRRRLRERRELPPDCGGAFPDAAQDQLEDVDHTSSSAPARR